MTAEALTLSVQRPSFEISVELKLDGVIGLVGPSGSGKSSVLRAVAGLEYGVAGMADVGYLGQIDGLFPHLSAVDNIAYPLRADGARKAEARAAATLLLEELGLGDSADTRPQALSGGQRRRVALARALAPRRSVHLLDEPFAGLDSDAADAAARFIGARLLEHDRPALIAGHDFDRLDRICGRIERIERGRLVGATSVSDAVAPQRDRAQDSESQSTGGTLSDFPGGSR